MLSMDVFSIDHITDLDLDQTFDCGQCFRWAKMPDGSWNGAAGGRAASVRLDEGRLAISPCTESEFQTFWRGYLDLDRDYGAIRARLSEGDPVMAKAVAFGSGIRILRQDLWETIVSFIISQNNNIPRIRGCIERLCDLTGKPLDVPADWQAGALYTHGIPSAERLAEMEPRDLAPVRLGYRAKYIIGTARRVASEGLPENEEELRRLPGVGPKVADCILLFGMQQYQCFPVDVWMRRVMHDAYGFDEKDVSGMRDFARRQFGSLGGFAQQYLFYQARSRA